MVCGLIDRLWLDPVVSITISLVIIVGTWGLLKDSIRLALHAVPNHIETAEVKDFLKKLPGVKEVHDLHIWAMSTTEAALSAHLLMPTGHPGDSFISNITHELKEHFNISHATIQIELGDSKSECSLAPDHVI
jgi:cobalt-zinc-cadmium efflux system protein